MKTLFFRMTLIISLVLVSVIILSACAQQEGYKRGGATTSQNGEYRIAAKSNMLKGLEFRRTDQSSRPIYDGDGIRVLSADSTPATTQHVNEQLYYWADVSNAVKQMKGIAAAYVFATNKNVYVAVMFENEQHAEVTEKEGYEQFHRHDVAPRTLAAMPYDHFYNVGETGIETNQTLHDVGRLVNNHAAPRQVFISSDHDFYTYLKDFVKIQRKNRSLLPWLHEFNTLVQYYFAGSPIEPVTIDFNK